MADSGGSGGSMVGAPMGSPGMAFEPFFKMWSEWMTNNMGPMTTVPGASLPWLTKPGVTTGEETKPLPEGAMANDPLLSAIDKVWDANPLRNIVPSIGRRSPARCGPSGCASYPIRSGRCR